tara:strand:- start:5582 stop:6457 length:876 start_codon:yes stop_codon:yes gene_type:complete
MSAADISRPKKKQKILNPAIPYVFECTVSDGDDHVDVMNIATRLVTSGNDVSVYESDSSDEETEVPTGEIFELSLLDDDGKRSTHFDVAFKRPISTAKLTNADSNCVKWARLSNVKHTIPKAIVCLVDIIGRVFPHLERIVYRSDAFSENFDFTRFLRDVRCGLDLEPTLCDASQYARVVTDYGRGARRAALAKQITDAFWRQRYIERIGFKLEDANFESLVLETCEEMHGFSVAELQAKSGDPIKPTCELPFSGDLFSVAETVKKVFRIELKSVQAQRSELRATSEPVDA